MWEMDLKLEISEDTRVLGPCWSKGSGPCFTIAVQVGVCDNARVLDAV